MRPARLAAAGLLVVGAAVLGAPAEAQLVPLARCHAAFPCNMPYALLPADAAKNLPDAQLGNTLIGVGVNGALQPRLVASPSPLSSDFAEGAARLYVLKHPLPPPAKPTPVPAKRDPSP
jgi:hypothetical protein